MTCARVTLIGIIFSATITPAVALADKPPKWIEPTDEVATDHIVWEGRSVHGPMRVLFITHRNGMREVVEVCQRFDIDRQVAVVEKWDKFHTPRSGMHAEVWKQLDRKSVEARFRAKLAGEYDCIVVAGIKWSILPEWVRSEILKQVKQGTGLVVRLLGEKAKNVELGPDVMTKRLPAPSFPAFPYAGLPAYSHAADFSELAKEHLAFAQYGQGRVVCLKPPPAAAASFNWGLDSLQILTPECTAPFPDLYTIHYEYYQALVGHVLRWASGRTPAVTVVMDSPVTAMSRETSHSLDFSVEAKADAQVDLEFVLRESSYGDILTSATKRVAVSRGGNTVSFAVPNVPAGGYFADLWVRQGEKTIEYGSLFVRIKSHTAIAKLSLDAASFAKKGPVTGTIDITGPRKGLTVVVQQRDNHGRVVARREFPANAQKVAFQLHPKSKLSVVQTIEAALQRGQERLDVKRRRFTYHDLLPATDDFLIVLGQGNTGGSYLNPALAKICKEAGFDAWVYWPGNADRKLLFSGGALLGNIYPAPTPYGRGTSGKNKTFVDMQQFGKLRKTEHGIARNPCLTDPAYVEAARITYTEYGRLFAPVAPAFYNLGDECMYAPHNSSYDLCFSETCVKDFRSFVKEEYGDIKKLNAVYGTSYQGFDQVVPAPLEKALADRRLVPAWIDHRRHADMVWARHLGRACDWLRAGSPGTRAGYDGTNDTGHGPRNGALTAADYYRLARVMDVNGTYYWPFQLDAVRDFSAPGTLIGGGWFGGYEQMWRAGHDPLTQKWWMWNTALRGANSIWVFAGWGASHWSVIAPDFSFFDYFREVRKQARVLKQGIGKLLMSYRRCDDGVAVLYSTSSMLLASLEDQKDGFWNSAASVPIVFQEALLQYRMLASPQVEAGELNKGRFRAVYLPYAQALSGQEVAQIRKFARSGGTVIADLRPAVADQHGKPYDRGALDGLFGVKQNTDQSNLKSSKVTIVDPALAKKLDDLPVLHVDASLALAGGRALADASGAAAVIVNDYGKGKGILLNMRLVDYIRSARDSIARFADEQAAEKTQTLLTELLKRSDIQREVTLTPYVPGCHVHRFQFGEARVIGLVWDAPSFLPGAPVLEPFAPGTGAENARKLAEVAAQQRKVRLALPRKTHIYDVFAGSYVGRTDRIERTVSPGSPQLFAALPYQVERLDVTLDPDKPMPGDELSVQLSLATRGDQPPGKHIFRVTLTNPAGNPISYYASNVSADQGTAKLTIPLAFNEMVGRWTLRARDVATGVAAKASFNVSPR